MVVNFYAKIGTMGMADMQNGLGGLPVRNFSAGPAGGRVRGRAFKLGGDYIRELNSRGRGGHIRTPACRAA